ncbi:type 1 glutamine amidotransferase [Halococcus thailandensis]|uniref:Glutamine amidotransferase class-I n=1 Tax=Halococcus thailandensis JCM 13552 TaxID=1227457 RepID=M0N769_9EURY|nr:type 1 glutamine amidotransferase [Halococcus thailandensis]EMA53787.1 glutamine amidotransferase class-I [Halococcus thailandensis JCM 13552]
MQRPRIALLNASQEPSTVRNFRRELDADLVEFAVREELPETFAFDAAVVTGSRASVYWDEPWIDALVEWVDEATDRELPLLGVCFGHQVLAEALGGTVEDMGEYEIGYREVEGDGLLFDDTVMAFTTHSDVVTELPPGAERTAENDYGIHGFRAGNAFGVQFHPEYDMATARTVTRGKELPDERIERVLDGITEENYAAACEAKSLFENFTDYVRGVDRPESRVA